MAALISKRAKLLYDTIVITKERVKFIYKGEEQAHMINPSVDFDRGDVLTLSDLNGTMYLLVDNNDL